MEYKINVVLKKYRYLDLKHVLHSMSILKVIKFKDKTDVFIETVEGFQEFHLQ